MMELIFLLISAIFLLMWRINSEMSSIQTSPYTSWDGEKKGVSEPSKEEVNDFGYLSSFDEDWRGLNWEDFHPSSSLQHFDDQLDHSTDIYTDPTYCHIPGKIYYHICRDDNLSSFSDDWTHFNWDSWS